MKANDRGFSWNRQHETNADRSKTSVWKNNTVSRKQSKDKHVSNEVRGNASSASETVQHNVTKEVIREDRREASLPHSEATEYIELETIQQDTAAAADNATAPLKRRDPTAQTMGSREKCPSHFAHIDPAVKTTANLRWMTQPPTTSVAASLQA